MNSIEHQNNVARMNELRKSGYKFDITADGYSVFFGDKFVSGASVMLPRAKPLHWRHRMANLKDNLRSALATVDMHKATIKT